MILLVLIPNKDKRTVEKMSESVCSGFPHCVVCLGLYIVRKMVLFFDAKLKSNVGVCASRNSCSTRKQYNL